MREPLRAESALRARYELRVERLTTLRHVRASLVSLAGLIGRPVLNPAGERVGTLADVVARWDGNTGYPPITGLLVKVGRRRAWVPVASVEEVHHGYVTLGDARLDLRDFAPREGEVALALDVIDHQLVDTDGAKVVRAADLYLARVAGSLQLVGVDVGFTSLLRRLGPARFRVRPTPEKVIDWSSITSFGTEAGPGRNLRAAAGGLTRLRPGELADLLEDLGRTERQQLLARLSPDQAADALEEMHAEELEQLLRESDPADRADLLARMEPDEAAEALRSFDPEERQEMVSRMGDTARSRVEVLLGYDDHSAGGIMNSLLVTTRAAETLAGLRLRLLADRNEHEDLAGVVVVDDDGRILDDLMMTQLFLADPTATVDSLIGPPWPVTVAVDAQAGEVAEQLIASRHSSVVVVDADQRPVGRILADDVIDALLPNRGRYRFPRKFA